MPSFSNNLINPRYHHPELPIVRSPLQNFVIYLTQFSLTVVIYWATYWVAGGLGQAHEILSNPYAIINIPFQLWLSLICFIFLLKIFHPIPTILGGICVEYLLQMNFNGQITWVIMGYVIWCGIFQLAFRYQGGDYYKGSKLPKEIALTFIQIVTYLPIFYFFTPFSSSIEATFLNDGYNLRAYFLLYILINHILVIIFPAFLLWIIDRSLIPYFPLSDEESKRLEVAETEPLVENDAEDKDVDIYLEAIIPKPGELYSEVFSHHSILEDNHTIVLRLGKVRVYLCTRCTAMILGVIISGTLFWMLSELNQWMFPAEIAIWLVYLAPIIPLTDWGLQALHIRPATTTSRLITGFILGICLNMIMYAQGYETRILIAIAIYFSIFGVLYYFRSREKS